MPIEIRATQPAVCVRREAFETSGLNRADIDARFGLTADEFRLERDLIVIGPLFGDTVTQLLAALEQAGLEYFDDYFELSGNWPAWLRIYAMRANESRYVDLTEVSDGCEARAAACRLSRWSPSHPHSGHQLVRSAGKNRFQPRFCTRKLNTLQSRH